MTTKRTYQPSKWSRRWRDGANIICPYKWSRNGRHIYTSSNSTRARCDKRFHGATINMIAIVAVI